MPRLDLPVVQGGVGVPTTNDGPNVGTVVGPNVGTIVGAKS